jgi:beta-lactamase class A
MRNQRSSSSLRWISVFLILGAVILGTLQLVRFSRLRANFPPGMVIAGVPVGGLDRADSADRLLEAYTTTPIELRYGGSVIQVSPSVAEFKLNIDSMLAAADLARTELPFWTGFWNYLWGLPSVPAEIPLSASFSEARLRSYLEEEIAARFDQPPTAALPSVGTVNFQQGAQGTALDIDRAILLIENAMRSPSRRAVDLPLQRSNPPRPSFQNLEVLLKQTIQLSEFDGLVGLYLLDLQTAQEIHFAYQQNQNISVRPDIAFTAASIIKVPIMVSIFRRIGDAPDAETMKLLEEMIEKSGNDPADWVMERVIDRTSAPLEVSADMQALGLENTFLGGQFYPGATLLFRYDTPANQRTDINTDPDVYNQTTPSDIGMLLEDIYQCNQSGGGAFMAAFPGEITQTECQAMITSLTRNKLPELITSGLPEGTRIAHKHGWVTYFGVMNTLGDAAIVYTPGGNYILVTFLHHPDQLVWEPASDLVAELSRAVYNYYNFATAQ